MGNRITLSLALGSIIFCPVFASDAPSAAELKSTTDKIKQETHSLKEQNSADRARLERIQTLIQQLKEQNQQIDAQFKDQVIKSDGSSTH